MNPSDDTFWVFVVCFVGAVGAFAVWLFGRHRQAEIRSRGPIDVAVERVIRACNSPELWPDVERSEDKPAGTVHFVVVIKPSVFGPRVWTHVMIDAQSEARSALVEATLGAVPAEIRLGRAVRDALLLQGFSARFTSPASQPIRKEILVLGPRPKQTHREMARR